VVVGGIGQHLASDRLDSAVLLFDYADWRSLPFRYARATYVGVKWPAFAADPLRYRLWLEELRSKVLRWFGVSPRPAVGGSYDSECHVHGICAMHAYAWEKNMAKGSTQNPQRSLSSQPWLHQEGREIQSFGTVRQFPLGLSYNARLYSCERLNQILSDSQILYSLYKKHHWLMRGATFYQLHLLLDKHASEQIKLIDQIAERVQTLGGIAVGDPRHVAEITRVPRPPNGCEEVPAMLSRLLEAHELILSDAHDVAKRVVELGDDGTNDLIVSDIIRTNELETWFLVEHLVDTPLVHA
jgi:starvation-inducible DNA-binding protein